MSSVFVDTDIVLDLFVKREPHHSIALRFFSFLKKRNVQGITSPIVIANTYYLLARIKNKSYAIDKIRKLRQLIRVAPVDEEIIDAAINVPYKDFEDSIQYHCAMSNNLKFLVTRNVADYPKNNLNIVLPDEYMKMASVED